MSTITNKVISIEYNLIDFDTKEQLDTNIGSKPLEFITGKGQIIEGLESSVVNMSIGDKKDIEVLPKDAYGEYKEDAIESLPKEQFAGIELKNGMSLYGSGENGETVQVTVKAFDDKEVKIDYNHPMAGKKLLFSVEVLSQREATLDEIESGVVGGNASSGCCKGTNQEDTVQNTNNTGCGCN
jgi:FKBP-type peptidyl-prolyl cis-trans isomerase SlyD